jgi:hypothetical protein
MLEQPRSAFALLAPLCLLAGLSCVGDPAPINEGSVPSMPVGNGEGGATGGGIEPGGDHEGCPTGPPRIGESCPQFFSDGDRCSYVTDSCLVGGKETDLRQEYCCFSGQWDECAADNPKCDDLPDAGRDAQAAVADGGANPEPDADVHVDVGQDAPGAVVDAGAGDDAAVAADDAALTDAEEAGASDSDAGPGDADPDSAD